ncbi:ABC transporter substrate-binding protein [Streptomyces smyrnaeus]|uniref:ABC transporter substrate-binding protein n=1 Tax=Streptomyces smyrnaeus TaxID=1387713 RepID=UPI0033D09FDE
MYRPRTRAFGAAAAAFALCAALAGCSQGASAAGDGKVVLRFTWWGNADRAARTEKAVAAFEKAHPNVDIRTSYSPYEAYKQKLATQAAGGDAPDIVQLDYRQISQYAGSGILLDLAEQRKALPTGRMDKSLLRTGQFEGKQYAIPMGVGTQALAYDKEAWREAGVPPPRPGWTWDDLESVLREVKGEHDSPVMTDPGSMEDWFEVWLRSRGKRLYDEKGQVAFSEDDLTRYWTYTSKLRKEGLVSPAEGTTQLDGSVENSPMGRKKAMAEFNWDAPSAGFESVYGDRLALAPMPAGESGTMGQYYKPSMLIGISAKSSHPREAARFIDFLLNSDKAADILTVDRGTPVNNRQRERMLPNLTGFQKAVADLQKSLEGKLKAPPTAPPRGDNALQSVFQKDYDQVAFEKASPRRMAQQFLTEARAELRP